MIRLLVILFLAASAAAPAQEARTFTAAANGQKFTAKLVAADAYRVTLEMPERGKVTFPQSALSRDDIAFLQSWRQQNPQAPMTDAAAMAPWPAQASVPGVQVRPLEASPKASSWESPNFVISSDLKLPLGVVRDLALVFEATREALLLCPLGLTAGGEKQKYAVKMYQRPVDYTFNGGLSGTAGRFSGQELVILLPEVGIKPSTNGLTAEHQSKLFVLKHEITHALLAPSGLPLPVWLNEGIAECVASWPYTQGRYTLQNFDSAMHDYLMKWRKANERKEVRLFTPAAVMSLSTEHWQEKTRAGEAYDYYNTAALVTHYFLFHDGKGDSANLAAYIEALRRGTPAEDAQATHLFHGRSLNDLTAEVQKLAKKLAPDAVWDDGTGAKK